MINFCTYFDKNYLSRFLALHASLNAFKFSYTFYVFSLDEFVNVFFKKNKLNNIKVISLKDLEQEYKKLLIAKKNRDLIEYYFTLTPFLPKYLHRKFNINKISYLDSDMYFFKSPLDKIEENSRFSIVLLKQYSDKKYGLYNVGWIYYNFDFSETKNILDLWSQQCLQLCTDIPKDGYYADQKYLDIWPKKLDHLKIEEPENYCLSPWDNNNMIEDNLKNFLGYHFHGLEIHDDHFVSGFSKYNKKNTQKIINEIYFPYLKILTSIDNNINVENLSLRNNSTNKFKFYIKKLRKVKSYLKQKYYKDNYKIKLLK